MAQTAADRQTARLLMDRGDEQMEKSEFQAALPLYRGAHEIMRVPTTGIELARCYEKMGMLVEARDTALEVLRMPEAAEEPNPFKVARSAADQLARELADQIPLLKLEIVPQQAAQRGTLTIDGNDVKLAAVGLPYSLNPGEHEIRLSAPGFRAVEQRVQLSRSERKPLRIELVPLPPQPTTPAPIRESSASHPHLVKGSKSASTDSTRLPWPVWLGIGVGGTGLVVGTVAGVVSLKRAKDAKDFCAGHSCQPAAQSDRDAALLAADVSNVGFALAALGATVSVASWWFTRPGKPRQPVAATLGVTATPNGGVLQLGGTLW